MRDLTEIRQQIDQIDQKMLALFKERMGCSAEVAEYKSCLLYTSDAADD